MTIAQQRDYVRRLAEGWKAASADQVATVRARTEEEAWNAADRLLNDWPDVCKRRTDTSGLVEQQRLFRKLSGG
jgi:alkanesulfonate monooxygenase SsuD/methylene tetrahydromethanopterin reductase-like flavin-dependent oxidoreductase (luciferase family)